jgi:hypothetical protein
MKKNSKILIASAVILLAGSATFAQTLEIPVSPAAVNGAGAGITTAEITGTFQYNAANNVNNTLVANTPTLTVGFSFQNQQFTGVSYGSAANNNVQTTGLVFGAQPTLASSTVADGATANNKWTRLDAYEGPSSLAAPQANMFTTNPNPGVTDPAGTGVNFSGANSTITAGIKAFTSAQVLNDLGGYPVGSRVYFGDLVISFSRPVKDPVIHIAGLGGSYNYTILGGSLLNCADYRSLYFTTELDMVNTGVTSAILSGNANLALSGNNIVNANHNTPNGGSIDVGDCPNTFGAATGSIKITGTVQKLVYKVYLQGGLNNTAPAGSIWSVPQAAIQGATHNPFTGDVWGFAVSLAKPNQQISGNVYNDADGLNDAGGGDINRTAGVKNPGVNVGGALVANLYSGATLITSTPVSSDGSYLFDNVAIGSYTVKLTSAGGAAIGSDAATAGWVNTGEFAGAGVGSDGTVNSTSSAVTVAAGSIITEVNFGIERAPESIDFLTALNPAPLIHQPFTLNTTATPPLPVLSGSDPEDQVATGVLTAKNLRITTLPSNSILIYDGVNVTAGQLIVGFDPSKLVVKFDLPTPVQQTEFRYAYVDRAGVQDPTPAFYRLIWPSALAVDLTDFTATKADCSALLKWTTETEINVNHFEIEASTGGDFKTIGSVTATGNSSVRQDYAFRTAMAPGVTYQFRIKTIENDGTFEYTAIRKLNCDGKGGILIAPNPVYDQFCISGMSIGKNTVSVFNADGRLVKTEVISGSAGTVNIANAASGVYVVRVTDKNNSVYTDRIIKK